MTITMNRREVAIFLACCYLGALFLSTITMWWLVLFGGTPVTAHDPVVQGLSGQVEQQFRAGEVVKVSRTWCATRDVGVEYFPSLRSADGVLYALSNGLIEVSKGCTAGSYAFRMPPLPPGSYSYVNTLRFQDNLVGRDQYAELAPISLEIIQ